MSTFSSINRIYGVVVTYTSKNELIVFGINESPGKDGLNYTYNTQTVEEQFLNLTAAKAENSKEIWASRLLSRHKADGGLKSSLLSRSQKQP